MATTATNATRANKAPKSPVKPRRLQWRARVMMAERGIRSVSALSRQLNTLGVSISESQLGRIIDGKSSHFNSAVVGALLTALDCPLTDLLVVS